VGQSLLIPSALVDASQYRLSDAQRRTSSIRKSAPSGNKKILHTVKSGDSLWKIAQLYGVDHKSIARWNNVGTSKTLKIGERLAIFKPDAKSSTATQYFVRKGDNLSVIAQRHNISVQQLIQWNDISIDTLLMPGQSLRVKQPEQG
jgi:membrane-bound lytic murein transglycosylase D